MIRLTWVNDHPFRRGHPETALAHEHCKGQGIELGAAAHNMFNLPGSINVCPWNADATAFDQYDYLMNRTHQIDTCGIFAEVDLKGEADAIPVADHSQDYVISSHVVEHIADTISAFLEWKRVLRPGGTIFMIFPKRDAAVADVDRPITELQEFIDDYRQKLTYMTHACCPGHAQRGHYHVFTLALMLDLIAWCNAELDLGWEIVATEETDSKVGNGHTVVARQLAPVPKIERGKRWLRQLAGRMLGRHEPARAGARTKLGA